VATLKQAVMRNKKYRDDKFRARTPALKKFPEKKNIRSKAVDMSLVRPSFGPQKKGVVSKVVTMSPKKPNSAKRHVAKARLTTDKNVTVRMPGSGSHVTKYNRILVEGGRANDLPGVGYTAIRGVYDFVGLYDKVTRRSIYGVKRPENTVKHVRRSKRRLMIRSG
jgi:small subunit ribosomal protein S12